MSYQFYLVDVFSDRPFGGNQLAVFPQAEGLTSPEMQQIAAEFNFSETTFVLPPTHPQAYRRVRIFTPRQELPFAGHPTLGTAAVLSAIAPLEVASDIYLEEEVGLIKVKILAPAGKPLYTELTVSQTPQFCNDVPSQEALAAMLSLPPEALTVAGYPPQAVSCGLPFLIIPVRDPESLAQAKLESQLWENLLLSSWANCVYLFCLDSAHPNRDAQVRMFAPSLGIKEDPATGSGAAAFAAYLAQLAPQPEGTFTWVLEQGKEIGRPSILQIRAQKQAHLLTEICVGGSSVSIAQGFLSLVK